MSSDQALCGNLEGEARDTGTSLEAQAALAGPGSQGLRWAGAVTVYVTAGNNTNELAPKL